MFVLTLIGDRSGAAHGNFQMKFATYEAALDQGIAQTKEKGNFDTYSIKAIPETVAPESPTYSQDAINALVIILAEMLLPKWTTIVSREDRHKIESLIKAAKQLPAKGSL